MMPNLIRILACCLILGASGVASAASSEAEEVRAAYERAAFIVNNESERYYLNRTIKPVWIDENRFWYRKETKGGYRYVQMDVKTQARSSLFDHKRLARAIDREVGVKLSPDELPLRSLTYHEGGDIEFIAFGEAWRFAVSGALTKLGDDSMFTSAVKSPDGVKEVFRLGEELRLRDVASGKEKLLATAEGPDFLYGVKPEAARWNDARVEVNWSPDSRHILTFQTDEQKVKELPLIDFAPVDGLRPTAVSEKQAFPGDDHIPLFHMVLFDTETGARIAIDYPPVSGVRMLDTPVSGARTWWSADGKTAYFVDIARGERSAKVIAVDVRNGKASELFSEETTHGALELGQNVYIAATIAPLPERNQVIWYSERSGWPHLYLYDLETGALVRPLTEGEFVVRDILFIDEAHGQIYIAIAGRTPDKNPYYQEVARVDLNTGEMTIVSAGDEDRQVAGPGYQDLWIDIFTYGEGDVVPSGFSPSGKYWVETQMRIDKPSRTVLRDRNGAELAVVEEAVVSGLPDGFRWPEPAVFTAADGETPIYGIICRPSDFDPDKSYPVIDHIYGGPQTVNTPTSFVGAAVQAQAVAELGFITVVLDGRGTPGRSRAFHEASYGAMQTASNLEDHIAAIKLAAERYDYIDADRVGIFGFSAGGYMTLRAMLAYPDFFDVGVSASGNHDQRLFFQSWAERYHGMVEDTDYIQQANETHVGNLKGDLLLTHGMMDFSVHPSAFFRTVQALMDANKDFDMLVFPRSTHSFPGYGVRRQWDYFVAKLGGKTPPKEFDVISSDDAWSALSGHLRMSAPEDGKSN